MFVIRPGPVGYQEVPLWTSTLYTVYGPTSALGKMVVEEHVVNVNARQPCCVKPPPKVISPAGVPGKFLRAVDVLVVLAHFKYLLPQVISSVDLQVAAGNVGQAELCQRPCVQVGNNVVVNDVPRSFEEVAALRGWLLSFQTQFVQFAREVQHCCFNSYVTGFLQFSFFKIQVQFLSSVAYLQLKMHKSIVAPMPQGPLVHKHKHKHEKSKERLFRKLSSGDASAEDLMRFIQAAKNPNATHGPDRVTLLHVIARRGMDELVEPLLKRKVDINAPDARGNSPLSVAAICGYPDMCKVLLGNGADIDRTNHDGETPLHLAVRYRHENVADYLTKNGAELHICNELGVEPIHMLIVDMPHIAVHAFDTLRTPLCRAAHPGKTYWREDPRSLKNPTGDASILYRYDYSKLEDDYFEELVHSEQPDILSHPWTRHLVQFHWETLGRQIYKRQLFVYILFLTCYVSASFLARVGEAPLLRRGLEIVVLLLNTLAFACEVEEFRHFNNKSAYLQSLWNMVDIIICIAVYAQVPFRLYTNCEYSLVAMNMPIVWIKALSFARGSRRLGPFVRILTRMGSDVVHFLGLFGVVYMGFTCGFFVLLGHGPLEEYRTVYDTALTTLNMNLGGGEISGIKSSNAPYIGAALYVIFNVISVLVLLNLLIAILSDSYSELNGSSERQWCIERALLVLSLEKNVFYACGLRHKLRQLRDINCLYVYQEDEAIEGIPVQWHSNVSMSPSPPRKRRKRRNSF